MTAFAEGVVNAFLLAGAPVVGEGGHGSQVFPVRPFSIRPLLWTATSECLHRG
jgi:hypothetical protein